MSGAAQELDTFDNPAPVETPAENSGNNAPHNTQTSVDLNTQGEGIDSFDNGEYITELPKNTEESSGEETKEEEASAKEAQSDKVQTDQLEDQEDSEGDDKSDESEGEAKKAESDSEDGESTQEEAAPEKPKGKTVRLKDGDENIDVPLDATVPVRIRGKKEFVPLKEALADYSGRAALAEKYEGFEAKEKDFKKAEAKFGKEREVVINHFNHIGGLLDDALTKPDADPIAAQKHLLEISGKDVLQWEKRMLEHYGHIVREYDMMDEAEQALYWTQKENEILKNTQSTRQQLESQQKSQEEARNQVRQLREQHGISEQDYLDAEEKVRELYPEADVNPEVVCRYVNLLPNVEKANELCGQFQDEISDNEFNALTALTAEVLTDHKHLDDYEALKFAAKKLGYEIEDEDSLVEELKEKTRVPENKVASNKNNAKRATPTKDGHIESFDDFDEHFYQSRF